MRTLTVLGARQNGHSNDNAPRFRWLFKIVKKREKKAHNNVLSNRRTDSDESFQKTDVLHLGQASRLMRSSNRIIASVLFLSFSHAAIESRPYDAMIFDINYRNVDLKGYRNDYK